MIVGHFATALIPHSRLRKAPLWLLLLASNLGDYLWLVLVPLGMEKATPESFLKVTFANMRVEMPYSHDLVPTLILAAVTAALVFAVYRERALALWCGGLVIMHLLADLLCGFPHYVFGPGTPEIGLGLYGTQPHLAILIEAVFGGAIVFWFVRSESSQGRMLARGKVIALYAVFVAGALFWLPTATVSLESLFAMFR